MKIEIIRSQTNLVEAGRDGQYLTCPNHSPEHPRLVYDKYDDSVAICMECGFTCQNFIEYPIAEVIDMETMETRFRNVITGEYV